MTEQGATTDGTPEGWWWPLKSRKAHYMVGRRSLCLKLGRLGFAARGEYEPDDGRRSKDRCAQCRRRLDKRNAQREGTTR